MILHKLSRIIHFLAIINSVPYIFVQKINLPGADTISEQIYLASPSGDLLLHSDGQRVEYAFGNDLTHFTEIFTRPDDQTIIELLWLPDEQAIIYYVNIISSTERTLYWNRQFEGGIGNLMYSQIDSGREGNISFISLEEDQPEFNSTAQKMYYSAQTPEFIPTMVGYTFSMNEGRVIYEGVSGQTVRVRSIAPQDDKMVMAVEELNVGAASTTEYILNIETGTKEFLLAYDMVDTGLEPRLWSPDGRYIWIDRCHALSCPQAAGDNAQYGRSI